MGEKRGCCSNALINVAASAVTNSVVVVVVMQSVCLDISVNVIVRSIIFIIIKPGDLVKASFCVGRVNMRNSHSSKKVEEEWEKDKILFHKFP